MFGTKTNIALLEILKNINNIKKQDNSEFFKTLSNKKIILVTQKELKIIMKNRNIFDYYLNLNKIINLKAMNEAIIEIL